MIGNNDNVGSVYQVTFKQIKGEENCYSFIKIINNENSEEEFYSIDSTFIRKYDINNFEIQKYMYPYCQNGNETQLKNYSTINNTVKNPQVNSTSNNSVNSVNKEVPIEPEFVNDDEIDVPGLSYENPEQQLVTEKLSDNNEVITIPGTQNLPPLSVDYNVEKQQPTSNSVQESEIPQQQDTVDNTENVVDMSEQKEISNDDLKKIENDYITTIDNFQFDLDINDVYKFIIGRENYPVNIDKNDGKSQKEMTEIEKNRYNPFKLFFIILINKFDKTINKDKHKEIETYKEAFENYKLIESKIGRSNIINIITSNAKKFNNNSNKAKRSMTTDDIRTQKASILNTRPLDQNRINMFNKKGGKLLKNKTTKLRRRPMPPIKKPKKTPKKNTRI